MNWFSALLGKRNDAAINHDGDQDADLIPLPPPPAAATKIRRSLPSFRGTAADQLRSGTRPLDRTRLQLRHAFTPARPIMDPAMLAGRTDLLRTMIRAIEDQYLHVVLFGPRGIGKTSLLHVLCGIAQQSRYLVRYVSCGERTSFDGLIRAVCADIPLLFHASYDPTGEEIEEGMSFADLLGEQSITVEMASDLLSKVAGSRLLIVLDEFDRASEADFRRSVAELIKNISDRGCRVQLIIAGVAHNLTEIIEHVPSIRRNILGLLVPNMAPAEIAELISNGQHASGMTFTPKALQLISLAALGLPYLASLVSQHAGFAALDRDSLVIDHGDVERGITQVLDHLELRIPPDLRQHLKSAFAHGYEESLGTLAQVALMNSFQLPQPAGDGSITAPGVDQCAVPADLVHRISENYHLIKSASVHGSSERRFTDDGVPLYLWVRLMHRHAMTTGEVSAAQ
jgi:hypothetical protein